MSEAELAICRRELNATFELRFEGAVGLLTALHSGPRLVPPSEWLKYLFEDAPPADLEDAQARLGRAMALYNEVLRKLQLGEVTLPPATSIAASRRWCTGYMLGVKLDGSWDNIEDGDDLYAPIGVVAEVIKIGRKDPDDATIELPPLREIRRTFRERLPQHALAVFKELAHIRREVADERIANSVPFRPERPAPRVNDPCPCKSGKKYKKCCGAPPTRH